MSKTAYGAESEVETALHNTAVIGAKTGVGTGLGVGTAIGATKLVKNVVGDVISVTNAARNQLNTKLKDIEKQAQIANRAEAEKRSKRPVPTGTGDELMDILAEPQVPVVPSNRLSLPQKVAEFFKPGSQLQTPVLQRPKVTEPATKPPVTQTPEFSNQKPEWEEPVPTPPPTQRPTQTPTPTAQVLPQAPTQTPTQVPTAFTPAPNSPAEFDPINTQQNCTKNGRNLLTGEECSEEELIAKSAATLQRLTSEWETSVQTIEELGGLPIGNGDQQTYSELRGYMGTYPLDDNDQRPEEGLNKLIAANNAKIKRIREQQKKPFEDRDIMHKYAAMRQQLRAHNLPMTYTLEQFRALSSGQQNTEIGKMSFEVRQADNVKQQKKLNNTPAPAFSTRQERFKHGSTPDLQSAFGAMVGSAGLQFGAALGMAAAANLGAGPAAVFGVGVGLNSLASTIMGSTPDVQRGIQAVDGVRTAIAQRQNPILAAKAVVDGLSSITPSHATSNDVVSIFAQAAKQTNQVQLEQKAFQAYYAQVSAPYAV
jgi:hypothetical protein